MRGSFVFILIAIPVFGGEILFSISELSFVVIMYFYGFIFGVVSCLMYSLLPGIVGGVVLAFWLSKRQIVYPRSLWISGGIVGGVSGLFISIIFFLLFRKALGSDVNQFFIDQSEFVVGAVLAILTASGVGVWAAFRLHKMISNNKVSTGAEAELK